MIQPKHIVLECLWIQYTISIFLLHLCWSPREPLLFLPTDTDLCALPEVVFVPVLFLQTTGSPADPTLAITLFRGLGLPRYTYVFLGLLKHPLLTAFWALYYESYYSFVLAPNLWAPWQMGLDLPNCPDTAEKQQTVPCSPPHVFLRSFLGRANELDPRKNNVPSRQYKACCH